MSSFNENAVTLSRRDPARTVCLPRDRRGEGAVAEIVGVGRIGAEIARALRWRADVDTGPTWRPTHDVARDLAHEPGDAVGTELVFLFVAAGEPGALRLAEAACMARQARGARVVVILMHAAGPDRAAVQRAGEGLAALADAIVVTPEYPHLSLLDGVLRAYRLATGDGPVAASAASEFLDLRAMLQDASRAAVGAGHASGEQRIVRATDEAVDAVSAEALACASGVWVIVCGAETLRLSEVAAALYRVHARTRGDAQAVLAAHYDERMGETVRVVVMAASRVRGAAENIAGRADAGKPRPPVDGEPG